jgi:ABC-type bacteriocin/lantibiotic exporter with double-glycine peptidase domain
MGFINIATNLSLCAVLTVGGILISKKRMTPGSLTRFAIQSGFVALGFSGLSTVYTDFRKSLDAAERCKIIYSMPL